MIFLAEWEKNAKPGDWLVYYTGHLAADSDPMQAPNHMALEVAAIGGAAYAMYRTGWFELAQRRLSETEMELRRDLAGSAFEYMIFRRHKRDPIPRAGMVHDIRRHYTSKPRKEEWAWA